MPGRKQTPARKLFHDITSDGKTKKVKCKFCNWTVASNGTRIEKHLRECTKCPKELKMRYIPHFEKESSPSLTSSPGSFCKKTLASSNAIVINCDEDGDDITEADDLTVVSRNSKMSTGKIDFFFDRIEDKEKNEIDELLSRAIYGSGSPLSIVENPLWIEVFRKLRPSYTLPSRYLMSNSLLEAEYERVSANVSKILAESDALTLMCDGWSNNRNESIVNFVIMSPYPVFFKSIPTDVESHTGKYMAEKMMEVIEEVGPEKFVGVVTDNASNMKSAWSIIEQRYPHIYCYGCCAHGLNLLMNDISKMTTINQVISNSTNIIKDFKRSNRLTALLKSKFLPHKTFTCLKLPVKTRWGSNVISLRSLQQNKYELQQLAVDADAQHHISKVVKASILNDVFWDQLHEVLMLLEPIAHGITSLEADSPQMSLVAKLFNELTTHFQITLPNSMSLQLSAQEINKIKDVLMERRKFCLKPIHKAANLLDPRSIDQQHIDEEDIVDACELINNLARDTGISEMEVMADIANYRSRCGLWAKQFVWQSSLKVLPIAWWKGICSSRPLAKVASKILSMPATTAVIERSFSAYSFIQNDKRNRLTTDRAGKLVFISQNLKLAATSEGNNNSEAEDEDSEFEDAELDLN